MATYSSVDSCNKNTVCKLLCIFFIIVFIFQMFSPVVFAREIPVEVETGKQRMVTSDGLLSNHMSTYQSCFELSTDFEKPDIESQKSGTFDIWGAFMDLMTNFKFAMIDWTIEGFENIAGCGGTGENASLVNQMQIFSEYVNVTDKSTLMMLTNFVQKIALSLMILAIVYQGYALMTGKQSTTDMGSTIVYFIKFALIMTAVYYAPYIVQEILNVNNTLVYYIANKSMSVGSVSSFFDSFNLGNSFLAIFLLFFGNYYETFIDPNTNLLESFMTGLVLAIVLIAVFIPVIKLIIWWYMRLVKIYLLTIVSPLAFATMSSPVTERTGSNYLSNLIKVILEQLFVILGLAGIASFMLHVPDMIKEYNLGVVGLGLATYAAFSFAAQIPKFATSMIEGNAEASGAGDLRGGLRGVGAYRAGKMAQRGMQRAGSSVKRSAAAGAKRAWGGVKAAPSQYRHNQASKGKYGSKVQAVVRADDNITRSKQRAVNTQRQDDRFAKRYGIKNSDVLKKSKTVDKMK